MAAPANNGWTWSDEYSDWYRGELQPNGAWKYTFAGDENTSPQTIPRNPRGGPDEEAEEIEQPLEPGGRYSSGILASEAVDDATTGIASLNVSAQRSSRRHTPRRSSQGTRSRNSEIVPTSSRHGQSNASSCSPKDILTDRKDNQVRRASAGRNDLPLQRQASQPQYSAQAIPAQNIAQASSAYSTTSALWPSVPGYTSQSAGVSGVQGYAPQAGYPVTPQYLQPHYSSAAEGPRPVPSEADEGLTTDDGQSAKMLRGTEGPFETLDPSFKMIKDHWKFFVPGRVFATLWWEPEGEQGLQQGPSLVKYGERAYAKVRRFIVVRAKPKEYYSKCIQISTHGGHGTIRKGLNQSEHTIVYTGNIPPKKLQGETKLRKEPIQVIPVNQSEKLDPLSRINLGKTYPVEHNLKVKEIGKVPEPHLKKLIGYWKDLLQD